jgi:hypothetical protein
MKGISILLVLLVSGMVIAVYLRVDPDAPLELEPDGRLFAGGRRVADDEASAERFFEKRKSVDPLVLRVAPGTDAVHLVRVLRAAHSLRGTRRATVEVAGFVEPLSLPQPPKTMVHELDELPLSLCSRGGNHAGRDHLQEAMPGDLVFPLVGHRPFTPFQPKDVDRGLDELRPVLCQMVVGLGGRRPNEPIAVVDVCPGVAAELVLKAARALRESGAGEARLRVSGEGDHAWGERVKERIFKRR